jgi:hypothetical protein
LTAIKGTVTNGQIILDHPTDLPEGARVIVEPVLLEEPPTVREDDWQDTPEAIASWLQWYESLEPLEMTLEEEENWCITLREVKERVKVAFESRAEKLQRMWE